LLRELERQTKCEESELRRQTAVWIRLIQHTYDELVALFAAQYEGYLGVETPAALMIFTALRASLYESLKVLTGIEQEVGPIYIPDHIFETPVLPECVGEEYEDIIQPGLRDTKHRLDAFVAEWMLQHPRADDNLPEFPSFQEEIKRLIAFRKAEERRFFDRAKEVARNRGWLPPKIPNPKSKQRLRKE
jgi:hypothetical protein